MEGQTLAIRTIIYNDDRSKKTLLMTHGYCLAAVFFARILPALAEHYRIVMFDNLGFGLNSRTMEVGDALESPEKAEKYIVEWWRKFTEALGDDLPPKFYLSGHSAGGAMCMLYASHYPERIEGMFLLSPSCIEDQTIQTKDIKFWQEVQVWRTVSRFGLNQTEFGRNLTQNLAVLAPTPVFHNWKFINPKTGTPDWVYDPYGHRVDDRKDALPSPHLVKSGIANYANNVHIMAPFHKVPYCLLKWACRKLMEREMPKAYFTQEEAEAAGHYYALMVQRWGKVEVVIQKMLMFFSFLHKHLHTPDRML